MEKKNEKLLTTKDYIMLAITLGGMIVSVTAWGYSLKGSIDLNKQATEQLAAAQKEANENVKALALRQNDTEKDVIGLQKDFENFQKKTLSFNSFSSKPSSPQVAGPVKIENKTETKNETIRPAEPKDDEENGNNGNGNEENVVESLLGGLLNR